jgi:hypothetical protein
MSRDGHRAPESVTEGDRFDSPCGPDRDIHHRQVNQQSRPLIDNLHRMFPIIQPIRRKQGSPTGCRVGRGVSLREWVLRRGVEGDGVFGIARSTRTIQRKRRTYL